MNIISLIFDLPFPSFGIYNVARSYRVNNLDRIDGLAPVNSVQGVYSCGIIVKVLEIYIIQTLAGLHKNWRYDCLHLIV
jgi:hypothetical protein